MAVAGSDFAIVAGDTRLSTGYSIYTRSASKIFRMSAPLPALPPPDLYRSSPSPRSYCSSAHVALIPTTLSLLPYLPQLPLPLTPCSPVGLFPQLLLFPAVCRCAVEFSLSLSFLCLCCLSASLPAPFALRLPPNPSCAAPFPLNLRCTAHSPSPLPPHLPCASPFLLPPTPTPFRAPVPRSSDRCVLLGPLCAGELGLPGGPAHAAEGAAPAARGAHGGPDMWGAGMVGRTWVVGHGGREGHGGRAGGAGHGVERLMAWGAEADDTTEAACCVAVGHTSPLNLGCAVYQQQHNEEMGCEAMAQLLANTLYYKRFFPYYTFNALAGLDVNGVGCVYGYDAVGSHERLGYVVHGTGQQLVVPVLDSQLKAANPLVLPPQPLATKLSQEEAVDLIKDTFASAAERDIYTVRALPPAPPLPP
ncbi:unnamed protein product [Closterium sp. NIES-65]|nr:unnamed protein product [Closterium sp. NIES-65]